MLTVKNLLKKFQVADTELIALNNLSFEVPEGQFLAITGRSGSGKSTLLYQLSLLDTPNSGHINLDTNHLAEFTSEEQVSFRRNNFGFIFQDYAVLPTLTAKENCMLPLLMQGVEKEIAAKKAEGALTRVGLSDRFDNLPSQLSGGQQQRVSIARAIVHNPKVLFADEPTANLDTESSKIVLNIFLDLNKNGQTIIMVTHEPEYALLAQRNIELLDGRIKRDIMQNSPKSKIS
jgi:putative ABC transport system ATP-binding protein